uniref:Uncharacterized protein n=1 Tax=Oryza barthii TaxID=65489 RepID=A0A0D3HJB4_9ORYZ
MFLKQAYHIFTFQVTIKHIHCICISLSLHPHQGKKIQELTCVEVDRIEAEAGLAPPTEIDKTGGVGAMSNDECAAKSP